MQIIGFEAEELTNILYDNVDKPIELKDEQLDEVYEVAISCKSENEQQSVYDMMIEKGFKCRILTM